MAESLTHQNFKTIASCDMPSKFGGLFFMMEYDQEHSFSQLAEARDVRGANIL